MQPLSNYILHAEKVVSDADRGTIHRLYLQQAYNTLMFALPPEYGLVPYEVCKDCGEAPFRIAEKLKKVIEIAKNYLATMEKTSKLKNLKTA